MADACDKDKELTRCIIQKVKKLLKENPYTGIEEAPEDDLIYGRQNTTWVEVSSGGLQDLQTVTNVGYTTTNPIISTVSGVQNAISGTTIGGFGGTFNSTTGYGLSAYSQFGVGLVATGHEYYGVLGLSDYGTGGYFNSYSGTGLRADSFNGTGGSFYSENYYAAEFLSDYGVGMRIFSTDSTSVEIQTNGVGYGIDIQSISYGILIQSNETGISSTGDDRGGEFIGNNYGSYHFSEFGTAGLFETESGIGAEVFSNTGTALYISSNTNPGIQIENAGNTSDALYVNSGGTGIFIYSFGIGGYFYSTDDNGIESYATNGLAGYFNSDVAGVEVYSNSSIAGYFKSTESIGVVASSELNTPFIVELPIGNVSNMMKCYNSALAVDVFTISDDGEVVCKALKSTNYTVAGLSVVSPSAGTRSFVTDALAPVFGNAVVGGGAVKIPVYYNGATWMVG